MNFGKIITAMVTPFDEKKNVDYEQAVSLANYLADNGTDTVLLTGTTGESPTLTHKEEQTLYKEVKAGLAGKALLMAGTGSNSTSTAIEATKAAEKLGVDSALIVTPYYNKPPQEGIYQHFKAIEANTSLPLMVYNIPGRTGTNIEVETIVRISQLAGYVAIKEASGDLEQMKKVIELTDDNFKLYTGDDNLTYPVLEIGGVGVVSVASHIIGKQLNKLVTLFSEGKKDEAKAIGEKYEKLFAAMFISTNPIPVKAALNMCGHKVGSTRLPLVDLNEAQAEQLKAILSDCGVL